MRESARRRTLEGDTLPRLSLTYGTLPTLEAFLDAFDVLCPSGRYSIHAGNASGAVADHAGTYTAGELFRLVERLSAFDVGTDETDLASTILETLGIEWI